MNYLTSQIVFQEIPNEISLSFLITGCSLRCPGCHSVDSWDGRKGHELNLESLQESLIRYRDWITCVLFMGGEWEPESLIRLLKACRDFGVKTALYTGQENVSEEILRELDFIKYGKFEQVLGGLGSKHTNQRLINLRTGEVLNKYFNQHDKGEEYDPLKQPANQR